MTTTITLFDNQAHRDQVMALWNAVFGHEAAHHGPPVPVVDWASWLHAGSLLDTSGRMPE